MKNRIQILLIFILITTSSDSFAQCCGAGSANPIASDLSQSVLQYRQMEFNTNYQFINTSKFLNYSTPDTLFLKKYQSNYLYTRFSYGVTKVLTFSVECGYWLKKFQKGHYETDYHSSSGISDIILLPRVNVYNKNNLEITTGLGIKIPVGSYHDSTKYFEPFSGEYFYIVKPPVMQNSNGSNDFLFNLLIIKAFPSSNWRLFSAVFYLYKGWNPSGEKFGDLLTFSIFGGKTFNYRLTLLAHLKYEHLDKMKYNEKLFMIAFPNYDPDATGSHKILFTPQINYSVRENLNLYFLSEIPVYQYVNKTQIASQFHFSTGIAFRFFPVKSDL